LIRPTLAPNGRWLVAGVAPNQLGFWDLQKNICAGLFPHPIKGVAQLRAIAFSRSGRNLAISHHDRPVIQLTD
jgi:hypothetical protein